ncbi:MAG: hypothetical protein E7Z80_05315 [Methanobrevibacter thaueri]|nr:hypothetical protein [Methanobrevibacter thaueri]
MSRKALGKGLNSLFPDIINDDFDSESPQSLADMLDDEDQNVEEVIDDDKTNDNVKQSDENEQKNQKVKEEKTQTQNDMDTSKNISSDETDEENLQTSQEVQVQKEHLEEVKKIVDKNPRITLWSSRSSAVLRYLRKTEPEFSISKEASKLIEDAVSKKYPEIWALFDDY